MKTKIALLILGWLMAASMVAQDIKPEDRQVDMAGPTFVPGLKQGIKEGKEQGIKEGIKEGSQKKAIEIAKNLLDVLDNETISLKTGLSLDEIEKLR